MNGMIISLYDLTAVAVEPWLAAGYDALIIDTQHPDRLSIEERDNGSFLFRSNFDLAGDLSELVFFIKSVSRKPVRFVCGFPPCTDLAVSGAGHMAGKLAKNPEYRNEAMLLVHVVRAVGKAFNVPWYFENPVSVISTEWRKPDFIFHPYEYGGYLPADDVHPLWPEYIKPRDAYPKKTCIWSGGGFVMPEKKPVEIESGFATQHLKLGGKSLKTKNIRSATPRGFSLAVYLANRHG